MIDKPPPDILHLDTLAVRAAVDKSQYGENSEALYLTSSFVHPNAATAAARFANEEEAFVYSRFSNPTVMMMERRLAALEGSEACIGTSSGMAAILLLVMGLLKSGDHVICTQSVFGSTIKLLQDFAKYGVRTSFVSQTDVDAWRGAAFAVIDATRECSITANLGDTKTTITHPASTSHGRLSEEQRLAAGITQGMIRLAVGLDDVEDLKTDLERGLMGLVA